MYRELYEKDGTAGESQIIVALIEQAVILASVDVDLTVQYLVDGCQATVYLKPPHNAFWHIDWRHEQSKVVDVGMDPIPSLADPKIQELLTESIRKIYIQLHAFCHCPTCRMKGIL